RLPWVKGPFAALRAAFNLWSESGSSMLSASVKSICGSKNEREVKRSRRIVTEINTFGEDLQKVDDATLQARTTELKLVYQEGRSLDELLPEAFAGVREVA